MLLLLAACSNKTPPVGAVPAVSQAEPEPEPEVVMLRTPIVASPAQACTPDGWCGDFPVPFLGQLWDVWAEDPNRIFAVGESGVVVRFDGQDWTYEHSGFRADLKAVFGAGEQVYAVGAHGLLVHLEGEEWVQQPVPTEQALFGVWTDGQTVVIVGHEGTVFRRTADEWEDLSLPAEVGLLRGGFSRDGEIWVGGKAGQAWRWRDGEWSEPMQVSGEWVFSFHGNDTELFATGRGSVATFDGESWTRARSSADLDVWSLGNGRAIAAGRYVSNYADGGWSRTDKVPDYHLFNGIWGTSEDQLVAVGSGVHTLNGTDWEMVVPTRRPHASLIGTWGIGDRVYGFGDEGAIFLREDGEWRLEHQMPEVLIDTGLGSARRLDYLQEMWGAHPDHLWIVGSNRNLIEWDGERWTQRSDDETGQLNGIFGFADDLVFAVGSGIRRWDGANWTVEELPVQLSNSLEDVWGSSPSDIWAVGRDMILHFDGEAWSQQSEPFAAITEPMRLKDANGVWGSGPDDVFIAMRTGVLHFDGASWDYVSTSEMSGEGSPKQTEYLYAIDGGGPNAVWVVGQDGFVARWDGSGWTTERTTTSTLLQGVWVGEDAVYASGTSGIIRRLR